MYNCTDRTPIIVKDTISSNNSSNYSALYGGLFSNSPISLSGVSGVGIESAYVTPIMAYMFYSSVSPVYSAVTRIVDAFLEIPLIFKSQNDKIKNNHPFLDILYTQTEPFTGRHILRELFTSFLLTHMAYPIFIGDVKKPPKYLSYVKGWECSPTQNESGLLGKLITSTTYDNTTYDCFIDKNHHFRYINESQNKEARQIVDEYSRQFLLGVSPLSACYNELVLITSVLSHNRSLITQGMFTSGIISPKNDSISEDQYTALTAEVYANFTGIGNAGRPIISNAPIDFKSAKPSMSDMDFKELMNKTTHMVYDVFHIPQPLYSEKTTTMSNAANADSALYEQAVLPKANSFLSLFSLFLQLKYPDLKTNTDRFELTCDLSYVNALKTQVTNEALSYANVGVVTVDEIRVILGLDKMADEKVGSQLVKPNLLNLVPQVPTQIQQTQPQQQNEDDENTNNDEEDTNNASK